MKVKTIVALAIALATSINAFAQGDGNNYWFGGIGGGMNFTRDGQKYENRENSHKGAGTALDVYIGKWFNEFAGFRVGYQGLSTSNQYTAYGQSRFDYGHADLLFNVANWFVPYIHAGYAHIDKGGVAGGIGLMTPIQITKRIAIVPDIKAMAMTHDLFNEGRRNIGSTMSGTLGIVINLGSKKKPVVEPTVVYEPVEVIKHDTVVVEKVRVDTVYIKDAIDDINKILSDVVLFDFDKYDLTEEAIPVLNQVAAILKQHPKADIIVEGHTDSVGSEAYNQKLSENRANTVVNYLKDQGVVCGLEAIGYGKTRPVTDNSTAELRHQNRRIEFRLK
jgi:outer membrane protein OmpA-like peptidoglycan-associated protein